VGVDIGILERLAEIFASILDADAVLSQFLALARSVVGSPWGAIYLRDEVRGVYRRWRETADTPLIDLPLAHVEADFAERSHIILELAEKRLDDVEAVRAARGSVVTSTVALALRHRGQLVGVLALGFAGPPQLPEEQLRILKAVAAFPASAIEHARVRELGEHRARLGLILRRFGEQAMVVTELARLRRLILDTAAALTGADQASITEVSAGRVRVIAGIGKDEPLVGTSAPVELLREALSSTEPFVVSDVAGADDTALLIKLAKRNGAGSFIALPMRHQDHTSGHLFAGAPEPRRFGAEEIEGMRILASMAAALLEQRHAQEAAQATARRLATLIEDLPIFVEVFASDGGADQANAAARALRHQLGLEPGSAAEPFPERLLRTLDGRELVRADLPSARALLGERAPPRELVIAGSDGVRQATVLMAAAPLLGAGGQVEAVVVGCQDVTKLHELAEAKDRFLSIASHELRSPITALRATTQLLEAQPEIIDQESRRKAVLQRLDRQSVRLTRLVEQLLDSARVNSGALPLTRTPVDLVQLCRGVADGTMPAAGPHARLEAKAPVLARVDALRIEQVMTNLLSNAARYSPPTSEVVVVVEECDGRALLRVSDAGIGIPEEQLQQLFAPFFRGSNAQACFPGGLGLGLHIAHEIVRRHGGEIRVQSCENEGTTFIVELPLE
jgi:signal transduction histidine kinase